MHLSCNVGFSLWLVFPTERQLFEMVTEELLEAGGEEGIGSVFDQPSSTIYQLCSFPNVWVQNRLTYVES